MDKAFCTCGHLQSCHTRGFTQGCTVGVGTAQQCYCCSFKQEMTVTEMAMATTSTKPPAVDLGLPTDAAGRKRCPIYSGVLRYFPEALAEVARASLVGGEQHHPGQPLHWAKEKSSDEGDALVRHLLQAGTRDTDGLRHSGKVAWRALALLQREIDAERAAGK